VEWHVAEAKERLSDLIRQAQKEPQLVYRRNELVAVVVDAATFERIRPHEEHTGTRSLGEAAAEARTVLVDENFNLEIPERSDRAATFGEVS
jgi:prevent-host-death family protein